MQQTPIPLTRMTALPAYLVVTKGEFAQHSYPLIPGQVTTIGRAATNRVIVRDEICSRKHCEIFSGDGSWTLRDLGSRNGTLVNGKRIVGDWDLSSGELIRIGGCEFEFTCDRPSISESATGVGLEESEATAESIIHRTRESRFGSRTVSETLVGQDRTGRQIAGLYRLALEMGSCSSPEALSKIVLDGLFEGIGADVGAILLMPEAIAGNGKPEKLEVTAYRANDDAPYKRVSDLLTSIVLNGSEAVLAENVSDDSRLVDRDSLGKIRASSVICAPVRHGERVLGIVHLYAVSSERPFDQDDLEFTLAVADQFAASVIRLRATEWLATTLQRKEIENQALRQQLEIESELIGDSPAMRALRDEIGRMAPTDATTIIRGESGVGKELVARAVHANSGRKNGPFVTMNCAALSESLLESELFGHEKGSFTGATELKIGKFEQAHGGSIFLDEVGEMSPAIQAKFLRVLEGQPFERVGGAKPISVDVRVIAATNRDLEEAVRKGEFRRDLYFRLHVVEINVPSLRDHISDVPQLAEHFLRRYAQKANPVVKRLASETREALSNYDWPGNIRELRNVVERAVILCRGDTVREQDIRLSNLRSPEQMIDRSSMTPMAGFGKLISLEEVEKEHILVILQQTEWNKSQAAQILGIERSTLDRKLKRYRVGRPKDGTA